MFTQHIFLSSICKVLYFVLWEIKKVLYKASLQGAIEPKAKDSRFLSVMMHWYFRILTELTFFSEETNRVNSKICNMLDSDKYYGETK